MFSAHHELARAYLNKSAQGLTFDDIDADRAGFDKACKKLKGPRIKTVRDFVITDDNIKVRIYRNSPNVLPVIVFFHGGGFVLGSIDSHDSVARNICKYSNCVVMSVEYGLAPEYKYPSQREQGKKVIKWLVANAKDYSLDAAKIFLAGDSAGGAICMEISMGSKPGTFIGQILIYPSFDPRLETGSMEQYGKGHFLSKDMLVKFWDLYGVNQQTYWPPKLDALQNVPKTLIITGEKDVLKDEGYNMSELLKQADKTVEYKCYGDMLHGFLQLPSVISKKKQAYEQIARFVNATLHGGD